ncbi:hypothetical protein [Streptomyces sp. enrichment culture]|uniref:hypothetical protein n=1 Tax=Streptomyces sp. enrichment culture TaxID=1795815 RepID=UPI003F5581E7
MPQQQPERRQPSEVSMRDLLASCAAASAVSTPPRPAPAPAPAAASDDAADERESETPRAA